MAVYIRSWTMKSPTGMMVFLALHLLNQYHLPDGNVCRFPHPLTDPTSHPGVRSGPPPSTGLLRSMPLPCPQLSWQVQRGEVGFLSLPDRHNWPEASSKLALRQSDSRNAGFRQRKWEKQQSLRRATLQLTKAPKAAVFGFRPTLHRPNMWQLCIKTHPGCCHRQGTTICYGCLGPARPGRRIGGR